MGSSLKDRGNEHSVDTANAVQRNAIEHARQPSYYFGNWTIFVVRSKDPPNGVRISDMHLPDIPGHLLLCAEPLSRGGRAAKLVAAHFCLRVHHVLLLRHWSVTIAHARFNQRAYIYLLSAMLQNFVDPTSSRVIHVGLH